MILTIILALIILGILTIYAIYPMLGLIIHDYIAELWNKYIWRK